MSDATTTDRHWARRASSVADDADVNLADLCQRELELDHICRELGRDMRALEVGCGNGWSTARLRPLVAHVDAFDRSPEMIERARATVGETNNRFLCDDVLAPRHLDGPYDAVICVRVLINLADLDAQRRAIGSIARLTRSGGKLILVEGFSDGFAALDAVRRQVGLAPLSPAPINVYSSLDELRPDLERAFTLTGSFHLGAYDYATRVMYPLLAGTASVGHNTDFHTRSVELARAFNPDCFEPLSRVRGMVLRRR